MSRAGLVYMVISAAMTTIANLLLRAGIDRAGGFRLEGVIAAGYEFVRLLLDPLFAAGFALYFFAALVWFRVIGGEPLSIAYPVMVGFVFVMVSLGAVVVFREPMSIPKAVGLVVILVGIAITSASGGAQTP